MEYAPYQQRVVDEHLELAIKFAALDKFLGTSIFQELEEQDQDLLDDQYKAMAWYIEVLTTRIKRFSK